MNFNDSILRFSKSCCGSHSGYISDIASTCRKHCDQPRSTKIWSMHFLHVSPMYLQCFYISATQLQLVVCTTHTTDLSQHEALKGVHVHENTLCVTSGAPHFRTHFRLLTRCFKYAAFHSLSRTHVRQTTLRVTFGARLRLVRSSLLGSLFGHLRRQDSPSTPERSRRATIWAPNNTQGCLPDLTSTRPRRL